jgi:hypothetical protein
VKTRPRGLPAISAPRPCLPRPCAAAPSPRSGPGRERPETGRRLPVGARLSTVPCTRPRARGDHSAPTAEA